MYANCSAVDVTLPARCTRRSRLQATREIRSRVARGLRPHPPRRVNIGRIGLPCVIKPASSLEDASYVEALMLEQAPSVAIAELFGTSGAGWSRALVQRRRIVPKARAAFQQSGTVSR